MPHVGLHSCPSLGLDLWVIGSLTTTQLEGRGQDMGRMHSMPPKIWADGAQATHKHSHMHSHTYMHTLTPSHKYTCTHKQHMHSRKHSHSLMYPHTQTFIHTHAHILCPHPEPMKDKKSGVEKVEAEKQEQKTQDGEGRSRRTRNWGRSTEKGCHFPLARLWGLSCVQTILCPEQSMLWAQCGTRLLSHTSHCELLPAGSVSPDHSCDWP